MKKPLSELLDQLSRDYTLPQHLQFDKQHLIGTGAFGAVYGLGKNEEGKKIVHKIETVTEIREKRKPLEFSEVVYKPGKILYCDGGFYRMKEKETNRLKGSVAAYVTLNWLKDNPYTHKLSTTNFADSRKFFSMGDYIFQRTLFEYEEGDTLRNKKIFPQDLISFAQAGVSFLKDLQYFKITHRDIKPDNVIRKLDNSFRFIDFSSVQISPLSKEYGKLPLDFRQLFEEKIEIAGVGTVPFMDKNAMKGQADIFSDLYSFGITLYTLATGKHPFLSNSQQEDLAKTFMATMNYSPSETEEKRLRCFGVPPDLAVIIPGLYAPDLRKRLQSFYDLETMVGIIPITKENELHFKDTIMISHHSEPDFPNATTQVKEPLKSTQIIGNLN